MSKKLTAWRAVHPDLRSSNGFRWPFPGKKAVAPLPEGQVFTSGNPCPDTETALDFWGDHIMEANDD